MEAVEIIASDIRTASFSSEDFGHKREPTNGAFFLLDITAISGVGASAQFSLEAKITTLATEPYIEWFKETGVRSAVGRYGYYLIGAGPTSAAAPVGAGIHVVSNLLLPHKWRVTIIVAGTTPSVTASVQAHYM